MNGEWERGRLFVVMEIPKKMALVATMLVRVVPNRLASRPPTRGVHVEFRLNAEINKLNSVLEVPISFFSRVFKGPRI
jgi:hypothetical protein